MSGLTHEQLLAKYGVPGMGDYTAPGGPVPQILERLDATGSLPVEALQFLKDNGLFELCTCVGRLMSTGRAAGSTARRADAARAISDRAL